MINLLSPGSFRSRLPRTYGVVGLLATLLLLGGCSDEPSVHLQTNKDNSLSANFTPPAMLAQLRAIQNPGALRFTITVNNEPYIVDLEPGAESGSLNIPFQRGEKLNIVVIWSERFKDIWLPLAKAEDDPTVPVDAEETWTFTIDRDRYQTNFDYDSDTLFNLAERTSERICLTD